MDSTIKEILLQQDLSKSVPEIKKSLLEQAWKIQRELNEENAKLEDLNDQKELAFSLAIATVCNGTKVKKLIPSKGEFDAIEKVITSLEEKLRVFGCLFSDHCLDDYILEMQKEN